MCERFAKAGHAPLCMWNTGGAFRSVAVLEPLCWRTRPVAWGLYNGAPMAWVAHGWAPSWIRLCVVMIFSVCLPACWRRVKTDSSVVVVAVIKTTSWASAIRQMENVAVEVPWNAITEVCSESVLSEWSAFEEWSNNIVEVLWWRYV